MLLLTLTSHRASTLHPQMAQWALQGDATRAIHLGRASLDRLSSSRDSESRALVGQLLGRCLLAAGYDEEAQELFRRLPKTYQEVSRSHVRWLSGLDQGVMMLRLNRSSRAAEALCAVADDLQAPPALRIEAMVGAAIALHRCGECATAWLSLDAARRLCTDFHTLQLVEAVALELAMLQRGRGAKPLDDHAFCGIYREGSDELIQLDLLTQQLQAAARTLEDTAPAAAYRLAYLANMASADGNIKSSAHAKDALAWLRARRLEGFEAELRIEASLMMIGRGALDIAAELLAPRGTDEKQLRCDRHALDLHYCLSKLCSAQGCVADALRWYSSHSQEAVIALRSQLGRHLPDSFLVRAKEASAGDSTRSLLPLRYRRGYQFIIDNLHDKELSVQQVAISLGVTERALQMAFRSHLGMTPAELIRTRRMERIREDLCADAGEHDLMDLANRWGITSRSTLASNYRSRFAETPLETLQGGAAAA